MKIVSFNLRYQWMGDGANSFVHRAGFIYDKIRKEAPDVIAFQEMTKNALELLKRMLPEYAFYGSMRTANYDGEGLYTAVKKSAFEIVGGEIFWLSPTPHVAGSRFEKQSPCPRLCVMAEIRNGSDRSTYRVFNVHLDHVSDEARQLGLQCLFTFMDGYDQKHKLPTVLLGDFNAQPDSDTMKTCNARAQIVDVTKEITGTFHDFGKTENDKIDYVYLSRELEKRVESVCLWEDVHDGIYLSDHYPVCVQLK